jgi:methylmalonyl-CoA mutase C-terminal domain/subunit
MDDHYRMLITKLGLDGHDRGSRIVAAYLRDAGQEVIYTGPWQTIEGVVTIAIQEDVDVIGISTLATDHLIIPDLIEALREAGMADVGVVVGGIVPESERETLRDAGVHHIFGPGASREEIVESIVRLARWVRTARQSKEPAG